MASRLDKLYELLESNNVSIRSAAAVQIGQIAGNCQLQLPTLLNKLFPYIKHKSWSTRISAADAVKNIGKNTKLWIPNGSKQKINLENDQLISLQKLNLFEILKIGTRLYSTDAKEMEGKEVDPAVNQTEINKHLGLLLFNNEDAKDFSAFDKDDFNVYLSAKEEPKISVEEAVGNLMGRKAIKRIHNDDDLNEEPNLKVLCLTKKEEVEIEEEGSFWPWGEFCNDLLLCLWHPKWEIRHGAATAFRELTKSQGTIMINKSVRNVCREEFARCHLLFMDDVVGRILCTLALDQLSDFVNDEMVAPVRESCAQCLGVLTVHLTDTSLVMVVRHLLVLLEHHEWTVTHGALLGLKYVLASRPDSLAILLPLVYEPICTHLRDSRDDDVRCAAAAALMPIFYRDEVVLPGISPVESLRSDLWTVLALRADYTSPGATGAILQLLEKLYANGNDNLRSQLPSQTEISSYMNRLHWCYYNYGESVRLAALRTCGAIVRYYRDSLDDIAPKAMLQVLAQLYQRVLVDDSGEVVAEVESVWRLVVSLVSPDQLALCCLERLDSWLCCAMQPARLAYSSDLLLLPDDEDSDGVNDNKHHLPMEFFIGGRETHFVGGTVARANAVLCARLTACRCLSALCVRLSEVLGLDRHVLVTMLTQAHLKERLALQRFVVAAVLSYWTVEESWVVSRPQILAPVRLQLLAALEDPIYYQELLPQFRDMVRSCRQWMSVCEARGIPVPMAGSTATMNLAQCQSLVATDVGQILRGDDAEAEQAWSCARVSVDVCAAEHGQWTRLVEVALARALIQWQWMPQRLTPLIRPLMETVRTDSRPLLQREAARAMAGLFRVTDNESVKSALGKLVRNLVAGLSDSIEGLWPSAGLEGVMSLLKTEALMTRDKLPGQEVIEEREEDDSGVSVVTECLVKMRGCRLGLEEVCVTTGALEVNATMGVAEGGSSGSQVMCEVLYSQPMAELMKGVNHSGIVASLRAMECCVAVIVRGECVGHEWLLRGAEEYSGCVLRHGLCSEDMSIRHWSARVLATMAVPATTNQHSTTLASLVLDTTILPHVLQWLHSSQDTHKCLGAIELLHIILHTGMLEYRLALVVPILATVLRSLNHVLDQVRHTATLAFSKLLTLLSLEQHGANVAILTADRQAQRLADRQFIEGLLRPETIADYDVSGHIRLPLRHYQQLGVNWLAFLHRYGLHGVLADDMGLGKTLQTLAIVVGETGPSQSSLVVCPSTVTGHWSQEVLKHVCKEKYSVLVYTGSPDTRASLAASLATHRLVITSYDVLRHDLDRLRRPGNDLAWQYLVLDEGHLIRNHKTRLAQSIKTVVATHRLVLTGTPVQNRVGELWSLFDFLMPGLLGPHSDFQRKFGRPLSHSNSVSGRRVDSEAGTVALEGLHKMVLPFLLRRVKEDVLHELPPKIIQDYVCVMTALQRRLYSYYDGDGSSQDRPESCQTLAERRHVFQAMHELRQVVNHPCLVVTPAHPLYEAIHRELQDTGRSIDDSDLSGKMVALRQLLEDCGLCRGGTGGDTSTDEGVDEDLLRSGTVASHRILIFCQTRTMLSVVETMLRRKMPSVSHLRMDGSVAVKDRQTIVDRFNGDPSIDILLLTTGVGGLGLNLTTADTVVFVEHDWNPMRDLQAMDRAHRIGQQSTVNVYRLITEDSIEERIMSLQQFKVHVAMTVVGTSEENQSLATMATDTILDLMNHGDAPGTTPSTRTKKSGTSGKTVLALGHTEAHNDSSDDYEDEYDLEAFVKML